VTGEVWISLEQNIIDATVNELRKRLHTYVQIGLMAPDFEQFYCRQLKNGPLDEMPGIMSQMWTKYGLCIFWIKHCIE